MLNIDKQTVIVGISADATDDDLRALLHTWGPGVIEGTTAPLRILVAGYDDTEREIWFEPKVLGLFQRIADTGLVSIMACDHEPHPDRFSYGIDAVALLACLRGCMKRKVGQGCTFVWDEAEHLPAIMSTIATANEVADLEIARVAS